MTLREELELVRNEIEQLDKQQTKLFLSSLKKLGYSEDSREADYLVDYLYNGLNLEEALKVIGPVMKFILNVYIKDARTKSGKRLCGSYEYERKDEEAMRREVKELSHLYPRDLGYVLEIIVPDEARTV